MWVLGLLLGTMLGSFILCLAQRSLTDKSFWGRSYCPQCRKTLSWYDLFPIASYLLTKGRCRYCKTNISKLYPFVEVVMGFVIAYLFYTTPPLTTLVVLELFFKVFVVSVLGIVFITDMESGLIPDRITYPAVVIALVLLFATTIFKIYLVYSSLVNSPLGRYLLPPASDYFYNHALIASWPLITGLASAAGLALFFWLLIVFTRGKGMGWGDVKLAVFIGLVLGFPGSVIGVLLSFLLGSVYGIAMILLGRKRFGQTIPFGPFLALGSALALFFGEGLFNWYLSQSLY